MTNFNLKTNFTPKGSQPEAIKQLVEGIQKNYSAQTLLGVTGSGKSLAHSEPLIIRDKKKDIKKITIGEFVDHHLTNPQISEVINLSKDFWL